MQLKPTLARLLVSLGFLRLMDFVLKHSPQAQSLFTSAKTEPEVIIKEVVRYVETPHKVEVYQGMPATFNFYHRQRIIGE